MTTQIIVTAHCSNDTEVVIKTLDAEWEKAAGVPFKDIVIQDGESTTCYVYDNRSVVITEVKKEKV